MSGVLLDTTEKIDHLRGKEEVTAFLKNLVEAREEVGCRSINIAEIYAGMRAHEREQTDRFIGSLRYFEVTREVAKMAGEIKNRKARQGITLAVTDTIIAATALTYGLTLVTRNAKHYPIEELKISEV